jgi:hypothetical protein
VLLYEQVIKLIKKRKRNSLPSVHKITLNFVFFKKQQQKGIQNLTELLYCERLNKNPKPQISIT